MHTLSSASRTCMASSSAVECTATEGMPSSLQARSTRKRDLAAVCDQDLVEHCGILQRRMWRRRGRKRRSGAHSMIISGSPNSTGWPSSMRTCITVPARGDGIWFMVFMASTMSSVSPALTWLPTSTKGRAPGSGPTIGGADHGRSDHARMLGGIDAARLAGSERRVRHHGEARGRRGRRRAPAAPRARVDRRARTRSRSVRSRRAGAPARA